MKKTGKNSRKGRLAEYVEKLKEIKTPLSTSLGALDFILLGGMGELPEDQKRFLNVAKKNLESGFAEIQKFTDWLGCEKKK